MHVPVDMFRRAWMPGPLQVHHSARKFTGSLAITHPIAVDALQDSHQSDHQETHSEGPLEPGITAVVTVQD